MAITEQTEQRMNDARQRRRQDRNVPLLIRDDGMLYPNVPLVAKLSRFRPYHGDPRASIEDRLRYLKGLSARRSVRFDEDNPEEPFELGRASVDEIVNFAMEQYGAVLDPAKPLKELRLECFRLSEMPDLPVPQPHPEPQPTGPESPPWRDQEDPQAPIGEPPMAQPPPAKRGRPPGRRATAAA